jgi:hypothetical protein
MLQLNLLPDVKKELLHAKMQRNLVISVCIFVSIAAGVVVLVLGGVMGGQAIQKNLLTDSIKKSQQEIAKKQADSQLNEYLTIQNQLSQIDSFKAQQMSYSRLFDYLKKLNPAEPNNIELDSVKVLSASTAGSSSTTSGNTVNIELKGGMANYQAFNVFKTTLKLTELVYSSGENGNVQTVPFCSIVSEKTSLSGGVDKGNDIDFTIEIACDQAAFDPNNRGASKESTMPELKIPNETTSDSDRNAPKDIFNADADPDSDAAKQEEAQ